MSVKSFFVAWVLVGVTWTLGLEPLSAGPQAAHSHTSPLTGVPLGIPYFCGRPSVSSAASGVWSDRKTWSTGKVPGAADKVQIAAGHDVILDLVSDATLACLQVDGRLRFETSVNTRVTVGNLTVTDHGLLEVGTETSPVSPDVRAEIVIADQPIDRDLDPDQIGTGIQGLGKVRMHGSVKAPTFLRLASEALAGATVLVAEQPVNGWRAGDYLVIPDTRQLRSKPRAGDQPQDEQVRIASIDGNHITLAVPLRYDHKGARAADGAVEFLPHVGNLSRNVVIRSENPEGTRGHMIFVSRADVDIRYAEVRDMGRTRMGLLHNSVVDASGRLLRFGANQIGRYGIHFHHTFGPRVTPPNGYQFTLVGNAVVRAQKWGITVHNSHYGLVRDNVVYDTGGAGIVTEDGTESFNVFDHNFSLRSAGSGLRPPGSGYSGAGPDPGGEGAGFWFRGPNNYIRNNVAADTEAFGFGLSSGPLDLVRVPAFKGADAGVEVESLTLNETSEAVLEFRDNEAYGAMRNGVVWGWNGTITNLRVWHVSHDGLATTPVDRLLVDRVTIRGDASMLAEQLGPSTGISLLNLAAKRVVLRNVDVQGVRTGISGLLYQGFPPDEAESEASVVIEKGYFQSYRGIAVATVYAERDQAGVAIKRTVVRDSVFEPLNVPADPYTPPATLSMTHWMAAADPDPRDAIAVYNYNGRLGDDFKVYPSLDVPNSGAPCDETRRGIEGRVCRQ